MCIVTHVMFRLCGYLCEMCAVLLDLPHLNSNEASSW